MIKNVDELLDEEILDYLGDNKCDYCPYEHIDFINGGSFDCPKKIVCTYGGMAQYPFCMEYKNDCDERILDAFRDTHQGETIEVKE